MTSGLRFDEAETALLIDLYELTMAASYLEHGINGPSCFSLSVRKLPPRRGYMVAAGLERFLESLDAFRFDSAALEYLDSLQVFKPEFLSFLSGFRFTGRIRAVPEGTMFFAEEPILEVEGPCIEAQLFETLAINQIGLASLIATKAARCLAAAGGHRLIDFGLRRAKGADAGLIAARSSYLAGFDGTSNVLAGKRYGIPVYGTMALSYVMAHDRERDAFANFVKTFPKLSTLLVDTYDTEKGAAIAAQIAIQLRQSAVELQGLRLDIAATWPISVKSAGTFWTPLALIVHQSSRVGVWMNTNSPSSSEHRPRSTPLAWAPQWWSAPMPRLWTSPTSWSSTRESHVARPRAERLCCRAASRCFEPGKPRATSISICSGLPKKGLPVWPENSNRPPTKSRTCSRSFTRMASAWSGVPRSPSHGSSF